MREYYLAVDIGASGGRHILGWLEEGRLHTEEMWRFANGMKEKNGTLVWDTDALFEEILTGMRKCREAGKIPVSMGIDTWGVDHVLLDPDGQVLGQTWAYRDSRTAGMDEEVYRLIPEEDLYARTGIQKQLFNTIYQLMAVRKMTPEILDKAAHMLMLPDYFHYRLTGRAMTEYTNATTTQLVSPETKDWDRELIRLLGFPERIFGEIHTPGTPVGHLLPEIQETVGFDCQVTMPATHDTGSAVAAVPAEEEDFLYISSGTWSLMGTERTAADCSPESRMRNLTNEGGVEYRFRYLKNIMGLWMIQSVRQELLQKYDYGTLCAQAAQQKISSIVDCNDPRFLAPKSMISAVQDDCRETGQPVPENAWEIAAVIYNSLGRCYGETAAQIEEMTGKHYDRIYIVGGGSQAEYLNQVTAAAAGRAVYAGPAEATATGNLAVQMLAAGRFTSLQEARACIRESCEVRKYGLA